MKRKRNNWKLYVRACGRGGCYYYYGKMGDFDVYTARPKIEGTKHIYWKTEQVERVLYTTPDCEFSHSIGDGKIRKVPFWE